MVTLYESGMVYRKLQLQNDSNQVCGKAFAQQTKQPTTFLISSSLCSFRLLNIHKSASLVEFIAEQCEINIDLGIKGKDGILKSMATRQEFLSDLGHRIRFIYTPKHSSWLNQVEIWFSILTRRLLKHGNFSSTEHLKSRILKFIEFFHRTMAKPFKWTYKGRPLTT